MNQMNKIDNYSFQNGHLLSNYEILMKNSVNFVNCILVILYHYFYLRFFKVTTTNF